MIQVVKGDLVELAKQGRFDVIVHGCNCWCTMKSGIALAIRDNFPEAWEADLATNPGENKLGTYTVGIHTKLHIVNAYTQYDYGYDRKDRFDYDGFRKICRSLAARYHKHRFGFPKIGSGLAGGNWLQILQIIQDELGEENVTIVEFDQ